VAFLLADHRPLILAVAVPVGTADRAVTLSGIFSLAFRDSSVGLAVGGNLDAFDAAFDAAALTYDGGTSWTLVGNHAPAGLRIGSAWVPSIRDTVIAVGATGSDVSTMEARPGARSTSAPSFTWIARGTVPARAAGSDGPVAQLVVSRKLRRELSN